MQMNTRRGRRSQGIANRIPLRVAPSGVSCLLTINLYKGVLTQLMSAARLPFRITIRPLLRPGVVAVLAFLAVFVDLSFGRDTEAVSEHMQEVGHLPSPESNKRR